MMLRPPSAQPSRLSLSRCVQGISYGCYAGESLMWVANGCRAAFMCDGAPTGICGVRGDTASYRNCSCSHNVTKRDMLNRLAGARAGSRSSSAAALLPPEAASQARQLVRTSLRVPSSCVPTGAIVLSIVNEHHRPLHRLSFEPMLRRREHCLVDRLVVLCLGHNESAGRCVTLRPALPSDHRRGHYHQLTWLKYHFLHLALHLVACSAALLTDADIVFFASPFTGSALHAGARASPRKYDFVFLPIGEERAAALSMPTAASRSQCPDSVQRWDVNSGLMLMASRTLSEVLLAAEPTLFNASMPLDQVIIQDVLRSPPALYRFTTCTWPLESHAEHCTLERRFGEAAYPRHAHKRPSWYRRTLFDPPAHRADAFFCALVTYHATCRSDVEGKAAVMRMAIAHRAAAVCN